ncbi:MAG TPA: TraR/DksA C4-type zinc finger protein [Gemmataceae bacterium]|nr:TraR/DksA C4-type zinc finger protein [Gemmataceae bacterium]
MTKPELHVYQQTLLALRSRLRGDVSHLANEALGANGAKNGASHAPVDMADVATDNFEQEFTLSLMQNQEQVLGEIAEALERIRHGTFGRCEECQKPIAKARLQTLPYTRHCVGCARKVQQSS